MSEFTCVGNVVRMFSMKQQIEDTKYEYVGQYSEGIPSAAQDAAHVVVFRKLRGLILAIINTRYCSQPNYNAP